MDCDYKTWELGTMSVSRRAREIEDLTQWSLEDVSTREERKTSLKGRGGISSSHFPFLLPTFLSIARSHALAGINQFKHCEVKGRKERYVFIPLYPSS